MKLRKIGSSSLKASSVGLGALHFGTYLNASETARLISHAESAGVNIIDTGPLYGNGQSEVIVGNAIKGKRDKFLLTTKVGLSRRTLLDGSFGVEVIPLRADAIRSSLESSLRQLGTDYIDLFQFHAFDSQTPLEESFEVMDRLVQEGKIRAVGASNYEPDELSRVISVVSQNQWSPLASLETHYNMIERRAENELCGLCKTHDIGLIPYHSLARGILTGKYKLSEDVPENSRAASSWRVSKGLTDGTLTLTNSPADYAQTLGYTLTQMSIAWLLAKQEIPTVLVGARDVSQLDDILIGTEWVLSHDDLEEIDQIIDLHKQTKFVASMPTTFLEK